MEFIVGNYSRLDIYADLLSLFEPCSFIDLGAGHCRFGREARKLGFDVTTVDVDDRRVPKDMKNTFIKADAVTFDLSKWHLILCYGLFYHLSLEQQITLVKQFFGKTILFSTCVTEAIEVKHQGGYEGINREPTASSKVSNPFVHTLKSLIKLFNNHQFLFTPIMPAKDVIIAIAIPRYHIELMKFNKSTFFSNSTSIKEGCQIIREHLTSGPAAHVTAGDGDLLWLLWNKLTPEITSLHPAFTSQRGLGGLYVEEDESLREFYKVALKSCPYFCVNIDKSCRQRLAWWALSTLEILDSRPLISSQCVHQLNYHNQFFPIIDGKRVLLIAGFAEELYKVFTDKGFQSKHIEKGLSQGYEIVKCITAPGKYSGPKTTFVKESKQKMLAMKDSFDVLMTSAGACSVILCDYAKQLGKVGFDIGANDMYILGRKSGNESWNWNVPECDVRKKR